MLMLSWNDVWVKPCLHLPLLHLSWLLVSLVLHPSLSKTTARVSNSGFPPFCNTLSSSAVCPASLLLPSTSDCTLHLSLLLPLCVCLRTGRSVCVCVCMNVLVCTVICVFGRKMSVTGFEREHVCPRTYRIPTLYPATPFPSHSASLAPPPPSPFSMLHTARPTKCYTKKPISTHMLLPRFTHPPRAPTYSYTGFDLLWPSFAQYVVNLQHSLMLLTFLRDAVYMLYCPAQSIRKMHLCNVTEIILITVLWKHCPYSFPLPLTCVQAHNI